MSMLDEFFETDVQTASERDNYLSFAKNVAGGHHLELELTGNAFHIRFSPSGVHLESLWDEDAEVFHVELSKFIQALSDWQPSD
jgi:hypothetical protein